MKACRICCLVLLSFSAVMISVIVESAVTVQALYNTTEALDYSSSTWADVNGDGYPDLVAPTDDKNDNNGNGNYGRLYCYDVFNNTVLWTYTLNPASVICSTPAVADLDGDDDVEIIFGVGFTAVTVPGRIYIVDHLGNYVWHYEPQDWNGNGVPDGVHASAAVGDLDRDGLRDFVIGSFDERLYAFKYNSIFHIYQKMWEFHMGDTIYSSASLANIDNDPYLEVMVGIPIHWEDSMANTDFDFDIRFDGGMLLVLNHDGTMHEDFLNMPLIPNKPKTYTSQTIRSSPAVADIDDDGYFEIVHTTSSYRGGFHGRCGPSSITPVPRPYVYAWNHDGSAAWSQWPSLGASPAHACDSSIINDSESSPAIGDVDLDGELEIILGQRSDSGTAKVWVLNGTDGSSVAPYPLLLTNHIGSTPGAGIRSNPVIAEIDDDTWPEFVIGVLDTLMLLDINGYSISGNNCLNTGGNSDCLYTGGQITYQTAAIWDQDCDMAAEITVGHPVGSGSSETGRYQVWDMDNSLSSDCMMPPGPWPMFRQNQKNTGLYDIVSPADISDLTAIRLSPDTIELQWTATGHNGLTGCAFTYDIRYIPGTSIDWDSAQQVLNEPLPEVSGTNQTVVVSGVPEAFSYTFAMKVFDEVPNGSGISNSIIVPGTSVEIEDFWLFKADIDSDGVDDIEFTWTEQTGIDFYDIERALSPEPGNFGLFLDNVTSPAYHVDGLTDPADYYYLVVPSP